MEALYRYVNAAVVGAFALFAPIKAVIFCTLAFICADFLSGVAADRRMALSSGRVWYFESEKARRTVRKTAFTVSAICMMWMLECCVLDFVDLHLTRLFAGFACGVELWSFLENASALSDAQLFEWLRRYVHRRIEREVDNV